MFQGVLLRPLEPVHIAENLNVLDFALSEEEMRKIGALRSRNIRIANPPERAPQAAWLNPASRPIAQRNLITGRTQTRLSESRTESLSKPIRTRQEKRFQTPETGRPLHHRYERRAA